MMVEQVDARKAKAIANIEEELNKRQTEILETAKTEIDALNKKAADLKIGALQDAQVKLAADSSTMLSQASHEGKAATVHQSTGTTKIKMH